MVNVVGIIQRQLDSLSTFVRQCLRSTGQRTTMTSDCSAPTVAALEDRIADDSAEQRGPPAGVDAPVNAGYNATQ